MFKTYYQKILSLFIPLLFLGGALYLAAQLFLQTKPFQAVELLPDDHLAKKAYLQSEKLFGIENHLLLTIKNSRKFTPLEVTNLHSDLKAQLYSIKNFTSFFGYGNAEYLIYQDNRIESHSYINNQKFDKIGELELQKEYWKNTFINDDKNVLLYTFTFASDLSSKEKTTLTKEFLSSLKILESKWPQLEFHSIGTNIAKELFLAEMIRNQVLITPIMILVLIIIIFYLFRNFNLLVWFLSVLGMSYLGVLLFILYREGGINPYTSLSLFFVLIVATSDLIHFFSQYSSHHTKSITETLSIIKSNIFIPCLLTTLTTSAAFITLIFNSMPPIQSFGIYCAFGSVLAFILNFYFLPFCLRFFPINMEEKKLPNLNPYPMVKKLHQKSKILLMGSSLATIMFILGLFHLKIDDSFYNKFHSEHQLTKSIREFKDHFNYLGTIEIQSKIAKQEIVNNLSKWTIAENKILEIDGVTKVESLPQSLNYLKNKIEKETSDAVSDRLLSAFDLLADFGTFNGLYNDSQEIHRTLLRVEDLSFQKLKNILFKIEHILENSELDLKDHVLTGYSVLRVVILEQLLNNLFISLLGSFLIIFLLFFIGTRSIKWSLAAMIPNLFPLLFIAGGMGLIGIPLESDMVLLVCITLGIAVDDTIHFIYSFRKNISLGHSYEDSLKNSFSSTSHALLGTTLIFLGCFPLFFMAELKLFSQIGIFLMLSLVVALIADLLILPLVLRPLVESNKKSKIL